MVYAQSYKIHQSIQSLKDWELYAKLREKELQYKPLLKTVPKMNDRIHIHSRKGIYIVTHVTNNSIKVTTEKWLRECARGTRQKPYQVLPLNDFKCVTGKPFAKQSNKSARYVRKYEKKNGM
jgi:hypothetical protein